MSALMRYPRKIKGTMAKPLNATNKDRLCERSEPRSYPVVGQARYVGSGSYISKYLF